MPYGSYIYDSNKLSFSFSTNFDVCDTILTGKTSNELLQLQLPEDFVFPTSDQTQNISLDETNLLSYFLFKSTISNTEICEIPDTPVKEEWHVSNGNLEIVSTVVTNPTTSQITGYRHVLRLINTEFIKDDNSFTINDRTLGTYQIVL